MRRDAVHGRDALPSVIALVVAGAGVRAEDTAAEKLGEARARARARSRRRRPWRCSPTSSVCRRRRGSQLSPELQRRKTIDLLAQWNLAISAVQPLVLFVEDLHWCDVSSLELLGHLIAQSPTARLLLARHGAPGVHAAVAGARPPDDGAARPAHQGARRAT